jgi:hypothetical protein
MIDRLAAAISGVSFHRGLALGALVGAAIAGSTIWSRLREAREETGPPMAGKASDTPRRTRETRGASG